MAVKIHIDSLVLRGVPPAEAQRVVARLQAQLAQRVRGEGLAPATDPGARAAQAIHRALPPLPGQGGR